MDNNTLAIVIAIGLSAVGVIVAIAIAIYANSKQGSRHDADIAALRAETKADNAAINSRIDNLGLDLRSEIRNAQAEIRALGDRIENSEARQLEETRELGYRIENRINLDERVRTVEQRTAPSPDDAPAD